MRDRLIELLKEAPRLDVLYGQEEEWQSASDFLLANGVIVPPMRLGQTCFRTSSYRNEFEECRVSSITQKADGTFKIRLTILRSKSVFEITTDDIGKTVFLTREEAERALKGGAQE